MSPFLTRRAALAARMAAEGGGVALLPTAPEAMRNNDAEYPYRHDSYFFHLTGFMEPEAVLALVVGRDGKAHSVLFCREKDVEREIWDGFRFGPEAAKAATGVDEAFPVEALDIEIPRLLAEQPAIYSMFGQRTDWDARLHGWLAAVRAQGRSGVRAPAQLRELRSHLDEMRLVKDMSEVASMLRAADIAGGAHARAMRSAKAGMREYEIEAELLHEFRRHGAEGPAYTSIVAAGANACVLHYRAGNAELREGELVLIDAGCEFDSYASDITRTFPVNGRFSPAQKRLYDIVLEAQRAAIEAVKPGARFNDGHDAAVHILAQGMLDTGLLDKAKVGDVEDVIANGDYRRFYMHRTGHWLGLDVHDCGDYREDAPGKSGAERPWRTLAPGMVLTVEPGIYVRPAEGVPEEFWNIGIRIEDDVLVTDSGRTVLSASAPKTVAEIEGIMRP